MYIVFYGELTLKLGNRSFFEKKLILNIRNKLKPIGHFIVKRTVGKFIVDSSDDSLDSALEKVLQETPGIAYIAKVIKKGTSLEDMQKGLDELVSGEFSTFKISTSRTNKDYPLKSLEVNEILGGHIIDNYDKKVKLKDPDKTFYVNIGHHETYMYMNKKPGIGGLPVGVSATVVSLLSGGIDSPVSSYMVMKRGCKIVLFHAYNNTFNKAQLQEKIIKLAKRLGTFQGKIKLYMVPYQKIQREIVEGCPEDYRMILFKRSIVRMANRIAIQEKAKAIITGDSIGQVASQTVENINCIYAASALPVLSPLIGIDKEYITTQAKKIETYETSIMKYDDCCSLISARHPVTSGRIETVDAIEKGMFMNIVEEEVFNSREVFEF